MSCGTVAEVGEGVGDAAGDGDEVAGGGVKAFAVDFVEVLAFEDAEDLGLRVSVEGWAEAGGVGGLEDDQGAVGSVLGEADLARGLWRGFLGVGWSGGGVLDLEGHFGPTG